MMKGIISVECNADRYFFGRLLNNKPLIRKERNDTEVIRSFERRGECLGIGIIDIDKGKKRPNDFEIIYDEEFTQIYKHKKRFQFLILLGPRQLEHWIGKYLDEQNKKIEDFGFKNFNHFMETSKTRKPEENEHFKFVIDFVLNNYDKSKNHIKNLKKRLEYIIQEEYRFDIQVFNNL